MGTLSNILQIKFLTLRGLRTVYLSPFIGVHAELKWSDWWSYDPSTLKLWRKTIHQRPYMVADVGDSEAFDVLEGFVLRRVRDHRRCPALQRADALARVIDELGTALPEAAVDFR